MRRIRFRRALNEALREELTRDERVFLIGEDLRDPWGGTYKVTENLSTEFGPERVLNTPIAEGGIVGTALGAALTGLRPVAEMMDSDFALLAMDQIVNPAAKIRYMTGGQATVPLVVRMVTGGYKSSAAQHGQSLDGFRAHRLLLDRFGAFWRFCRGFQLRDPRREHGDDAPVLAIGLVRLLQLRP